MMRISKLLALGAFGIALIGGARTEAGTLVYDNGPINGTINAVTINESYEVSDTFTVTAPTQLVSAQIGLWVAVGDTPVTVDWAIGTTAYGTDVASGTATLSNSVPYVNSYGYDIYESTFSLSGTVSAGTTYWLSLQNATTIPANYLFWDVNNGPSVAFQTGTGNLNGTLSAGSNSESFQLYGVQGVPEPSSFVLAAMGAIGGLGTTYARRRRGRVAA